MRIKLFTAVFVCGLASAFSCNAFAVESSSTRALRSVTGTDLVIHLLKSDLAQAPGLVSARQLRHYRASLRALRRAGSCVAERPSSNGK